MLYFVIVIGSILTFSFFDVFFTTRDHQYRACIMSVENPL